MFQGITPEDYTEIVHGAERFLVPEVYEPTR
jgi:hypothetical protein